MDESSYNPLTYTLEHYNAYHKTMFEKDIVNTYRVGEGERDRSGNVIRAFAPHKQGVKCCVLEESPIPTEMVGQDMVEFSHSVFFFEDPGLNNGDMIEWIGGIRRNNREWVVRKFVIVRLERVAEIEIYWKCMVEEYDFRPE